MTHRIATSPLLAAVAATATSITAFTPAARAQEAFDLGQITVFANQAEAVTDLARTGTTTEVITADDLAQSGSAKLADVIADLPGVSVSANGGLGANTALRVRGLDGKYIAVRIDGIDVSDPSSTQVQFDWGLLSTEGVSRIELLKGSQSAVFGSEAIGGVINITTARAGQPGNSATVTGEAGSFGTYRAGLSAETRSETGGLAFSLNRVETDGFSARDGAANTEADGFRATQLTFSADVAATDLLTLGISGYALNGDGSFDEFGGDGAPPFDEFNSVETRALRIFADLDLGSVQHGVAASYYTNDRLSSSNGFATVFDGTRRTFEYKGSYAASDAVSYGFGADLTRETYDSGADSGTEDVSGIFGEVLYAPDADLDLALSLRYDDHSAFGGNLSGRAALAYRMGAGTVLRGVASTGFRAPSLYELNNTLYGNAALQPEESRNFELGIEHDYASGANVRATAFYTEIDNLIQFVTLTSFPLPFTGQYRQVPGTSTSKGIELSGEWALRDGLRLFGSYTYTDARDATGAPLLRVPGHDLVLGMAADMGRALSGRITLNRIADRPAEFGVAMPDYTVVNAGLGYDITDDAQVYLRIENLLDEDYQTSSGFSTAGRAVYLGVRATF
ncbi:MAG: TonB-dependent receptor [Rhodobacteraceae bacterium]|nr:TonB-dependent receptor [Paracoccaceae bacterium]